MKFVSRYCLKDLRELNLLTLEQVTDRTTIPLERLKFLESDSTKIEASERQCISKLYNLSMEYIFFGKQADFDRKLNEYLGGTP